MIFLFRRNQDNDLEYRWCRKYFETLTHRHELYNEEYTEGTTVIARYSALPFYEEVVVDIEAYGYTPINSYAQHRWIADFDYYRTVHQYTPNSWTQDEMVYNDYDGPYVVKGATNSKKWKWKELMWAHNKKEALRIGYELSQDGLIGQQQVIYRKYVPLETLEEGINGIPFANEWRFFFLGNKLIDYGYYWSNAEQYPEKIDEKGYTFAISLAQLVSKHTNFFVLDVAKTQEGQWILIEINDGQMSGLSTIPPERFYKNLFEMTKEETIDV